MTCFLLFWLGCLVFIIVNSLGKSSEAESVLQAELAHAKKAALRLERENRELSQELQRVQQQNRPQENHEEKLVQDSGPLVISRNEFLDGPSKEYEVLRRQLGRDVNEFSRFVRGVFEGIVANKKDIDPQLKTFLEESLVESRAHSKAIMADLHQLTVRLDVMASL
jgi:transcription termination factor NusB